MTKRRVLRVVAGYAIVCFVVLQIADVTFEPLEIGNAVLKIIIAVMLLALPVVAYLSWVFDVGPDGEIHRTPASRDPTSTSPRLPLFVMSGAVAFGLLAAGGWYVWKSTKAPSDVQIRSLAVLPFDNLSGDPDQDYVADGMTGAIIDELGKLELLKVISRLTVMRYKEDQRPPRDIAMELGVQALVGGAVFKEGGQYRVTVELIDAQSDKQVWNDRFDRNLSEVLALHLDVARAVVREIHLELSPREETSLADARLVDPVAYEAFQKGQYLQNTVERDDWSAESLLKAVDYYQEAIHQDPSWALPFASLARTYHFLDKPEYMVLSKEASRKALALDDGLALAHSALAYVLMMHDHDWESAERAYRRSFELNPNGAHWGYAILMESLGRWEESIDAFKRAEEQSPDSLQIKSQLGGNYLCAGQADNAEKQLRKVLELEPNFLQAHQIIGHALIQASKAEQAIAEIESAMKLCDGSACEQLFLPALAEAYVSVGRTNEAVDILHELEATGTAFIPGLYAALGQKDKLLTQLEETGKLGFVRYVKCEQWQQTLAEEPRYVDLLRRLNLPQG